ncbi:hypothetical protein [Streptomyces spiramyceticus]|uniref:hypothetical protein n=1 Tax=Streptomyces spiramyceticus TaxID=299717 RepID=UPI00237AB330|nr:hypothetical protein [Streptomyces spiramyceticus]
MTTTPASAAGSAKSVMPRVSTIVPTAANRSRSHRRCTGMSMSGSTACNPVAVSRSPGNSAAHAPSPAGEVSA